MKRLAATSFAVTNGAIGGLIGVGVFAGLPNRWAWVDVPALIVVALLLASSVALLAQRAWSLLLVRIAGFVLLGLGLALITGLIFSAAFMGGMLGDVGKRGAMLFLLVMALVIPYVLVYPSALLLWASGRTGEGQSG